MNKYTIYSVNGPVVGVKGGSDLSMYDMVYVGEQNLIGEVVSIQGDLSIVQVYENTVGLMPGMPVQATNAPMSVTLGPGLLRGIFDGIARPLKEIEKKTGVFMSRGVNIPTLDPIQRWDVEMKIKTGDVVTGGRIIAECTETPVIRHKILVPPNISGRVTEAVSSGSYTVLDVIATVTGENGRRHELTLCHSWPIRRPRPSTRRVSANEPLITGQRIIDTFFPVVRGGAAGIPGPFGAGKTITQHQLAKWSDADLIVYIGCGERGNEMTEVLDEFSELVDPKTGHPLTDRTILIANTSNMPVASREASIYTGITIAEYYRDMGYHVAMMADSTSRWAEALREISGRLEEMPAEEGFPAYLPSRLAEFYERAGCMETLGDPKIRGSVTVIGAVSPQGSDFSEPVTQNTKRFTRVFWALDRSLAYARHFPAINWTSSYSEYLLDLEPWYSMNVGHDFVPMRQRVMALLHEEDKLMEIVRLIGSDILPDDQKLVIEISRVVRLGFLQQNAYHEIDTYVPLQKQRLMLKLILYLYDRAKELISRSIPISQLRETGIFDDVIRVKYDIPNDKPEMFDAITAKVDDCVTKVFAANG